MPVNLLKNRRAAMKKMIINIIVINMMLLLMACSSPNENSEVIFEDDIVEDMVEDLTDNSIEDASDSDSVEVETDALDYDEFSKATDVLPDYEYPGPEAFYDELYDYVEDLEDNYPESDVSIPCIRIVDIDDSDKADIRVYGDFAIYNYNLSGDTLTCASGGDYPGLIHMEYDTEDGDYDVIDFDVVGDGSEFEVTAKRIFGNKYDDFMKIYSDQDNREEVRAQIIANYVAANNLDIKYYQDYGWDKVELPAENIDSFYSVLD